MNMKRRWLWSLPFIIVAMWLWLASPGSRDVELREDSSIGWQSLPSKNEQAQVATQNPKAIARALAGESKSTDLAAQSDDSEAQRCGDQLQKELEPNSEFATRFVRDSARIVGEWYYEKFIHPDEDGKIESIHAEPVENFDSGKFLLGLAKAGFLDGETHIRKDPLGAMKLLTEASEGDPSNSAPLVYLAILQHQLNLLDNENETLDKISRSDHFNSHVKELAREVYATVHSPSDLMNATSLWARFSIPNYSGEFKTYLEKHHLDRVAEQMTREIPEAAPKFSDLQWVPIEAAIGLSVRRKLAPDSRSIMSKEEFRKRLNFAAAHSTLGDVNFETTCSSTELWSSVRTVEAVFDSDHGSSK